MGDILNLANKAIGDAPEEQVLANGTEAQIRIMAYKLDKDKNDKNYFMPVFDVPDEPNVREFSKFMYIPDESWMDEKKFNRARRDFQEFGDAFGIDWDSGDIDLDSLIGTTAWAILGVKKADGDFPESNSVRKFVSGN